MTINLTSIPRVLSLLAMLLLMAVATHLQAQPKGGAGHAPPPPVRVPPYDPLSHDPKRPNQYDVEYSRLGSHSEMEAMLKYGNEARAATPPRLEDAERDDLRAAEIDPKEARAYVGLGNVYAAQNRVEEHARVRPEGVLADANGAHDGLQGRAREAARTA